MMRVLLVALAVAAVGEPSWACKHRRGRGVVYGPAATPRMPTADDKVMLRAKLQKGLVFFQEIETDTEGAMKVMGQDLKQTQRQTFVLRWEVLGQDPKGQWQLTSKIIGVKMDIDIGGNRIHVYHYDTPAKEQNPLSEFVKQLMELDLKYTLTSEFQVAIVEGLDKLVDKLSRIKPSMKTLVEKVLNESAVKAMAAGLFEPLPNRAVRPGETWVRRSLYMDLGPVGVMQPVMTYRYEGRHRDLDKISVKTEILFEGPGKGDGLPFTVRAADLKGHSGGGEVLFDRRLGRIVSSTLSHRLQGQIVIEVGGMKTVVDLDQRQTTRLRITDYNPMPKGE